MTVQNSSPVDTSVNSPLKTPLKTKILIFFCSLFFFLFLLETGLQTASFFIVQKKIDTNINQLNPDMPIDKRMDLNHSKKNSRINIMCIGDSYTVGGFGKPEKSYPALLQKELNRLFPEKFNVINGAYCEYNSRSTLISLKNFYKMFKIDILMILSGSTNKFNFKDQDFDDIIYGFKFLWNLKTFKIARIIYLNLKGKALSDKSENTFLKSVFQTEDYVPGYESKLAVLSEKYMARYSDNNLKDFDFNKKSNLSTKEKFTLQIWKYINDENFSEAKKIYDQASKNNFYSPENDIALAYIHFMRQNSKYAVSLLDSIYKKYASEKIKALCFYLFEHFADIAAEEKNFDKAVFLYAKAIEKDPSDFGNYYRLMKLFDIQSTVSADSVNLLFKNIEKNNPHITKAKLFIKYKAYFDNKTIFEQKIKDNLLSDINNMITLAKNNKSSVIILTYPHPYETANSALKACSENNKNIQFLDLEKIFRKQLQTNDRKIYFIDDDHCTDKGHQLMVTSIINEFKDFFETKQKIFN
jgi:lysophospholipase L1-like esterase